MEGSKSDKALENLIIRLPVHLKRKAKSLASLQGRSLQEVAEELWNKWVAEQESKEVKDE